MGLQRFDLGKHYDIGLVDFLCFQQRVTLLLFRFKETIHRYRMNDQIAT
jgi:hypothetical protein